MKYAVVTLVLFTMCMGGCSNSTSSSGTGGSGIIYLWIGVDKDTYVHMEDSDRNYGDMASLVVADWESTHKRTYVHFLLPILPDGTEILEAYLELFHSGANEDGKTDDIDIGVQRASGTWSPLTLTWDNEPTFYRAPEFMIDLESQAWSGSDDISSIVTGMFDDPDSDYGFVVSWSMNPTGLGIEKGFYSNNHIYRKADDLWLSPRLLVKIQLPSGKTTSDISLPALPTDNDIDFPAGTNILMLNFSSAADWPDDWDVAIRD